MSRLYTQALYQGGALEDDFGIRYHFNQIQSLNKSNPVAIQVHNIDIDSEPEHVFIPTDIYSVFQYVLNKKKNIQFTRAVKIQANNSI
jgi:hypothetical protein